jgi:dipeptidyl aminopeptidase/acylaminoacyl peptidase
MALAVLIGSALLAGPVMAAEYHSFAAADGTRINYAVVLPEDYQPGETYPVMLAFPPGPQTKAMVEAGLRFWEGEGARRGYVVVSPVAPRQGLYFQGGAPYIADIFAEISNRYDVAGGKVHVSGISNGGLSAFQAAAAFPELVKTITVLPGFPAAGNQVLALLKDVPLIMFAGERDQGWITRMDATAEAMRRLGGDVHYEIVPNEGHVIQSLAGRNASRLFDLIDARR